MRGTRRPTELGRQGSLQWHSGCSEHRLVQASKLASMLSATTWLPGSMVCGAAMTQPALEGRNPSERHACPHVLPCAQYGSNFTCTHMPTCRFYCAASHPPLGMLRSSAWGRMSTFRVALQFRPGDRTAG